MSRKRFTVAAVALLSISGTALYYRAQIRADHERIAAMERHTQEGLDLAAAQSQRQRESDAAEREMPDWQQAVMRNESNVSLTIQQRGVLSGLPPGAGRTAVERELMKTRSRIVMAPAAPPDMITFINDKMMFEGTTFTLPDPRNVQASTSHGEITISDDAHTLRFRSGGDLFWDGGDYGRTPWGGTVEIRADGSVLVNGQTMHRIDAPTSRTQSPITGFRSRGEVTISGSIVERSSPSRSQRHVCGGANQADRARAYATSHRHRRTQWRGQVYECPGVGGRRSVHQCR